MVYLRPVVPAVPDLWTLASCMFLDEIKDVAAFNAFMRKLVVGNDLPTYRLHIHTILIPVEISYSQLKFEQSLDTLRYVSFQNYFFKGP